MARIRLNLLSVLLAGAGIFGMATVDAATVAYYKWENGTAGQRAHGEGAIPDSSGNGLDGWASGALKYQAVSNPDSTLAMHFDGKTGRVWIPDNPLLELTHGLTLEAYIYLRSIKQGLILLRSDQRYDYDPYYLMVNAAGVLQFQVQGVGVGKVLFSPSPLPLQQWMHIAGTLDDATGAMGLYINGSLVASSVIDFRARGPLTGRHAGLGIGAGIKGSPDDYFFFHGSIDDVRISDVALDPSQFLPPP
jgi:hypothetical protein